MKTINLTATLILLAATGAAAIHPMQQLADPSITSETVQRARVQVVSLPPSHGAVETKQTAAAEGTKGYVLQQDIKGITPKGLVYYVDKDATHSATLVKYTKESIEVMQAKGLDVSFGGTTLPATAEGVVKIFEGNKGCPVEDAYGATFPRAGTIEGTDTSFIYDATIYICPKLFNKDTWAKSAIIQHEIGHSVGLDHFNKEYEGTTQLMRAYAKQSVYVFKKGDKQGFAVQAVNTENVKKQTPPIGALESAKYVKGNVNLKGWAVLEYFPDEKAIITLTDNGTQLAKFSTNVARQDINDKYTPGSTTTHGFFYKTPWDGKKHKYCATATAPFTQGATTNLGCFTVAP